MKSLTIALICFISFDYCEGQIPSDSVLSRFLKMQEQWKKFSYTGKRTDTLVTDDVRTFNGTVLLEKAPGDTITGFRFSARKRDDSITSVYDGRYGYDVYQSTGDYTINSRPDEYLLINGGGQLIPRDVFRLDTAGATLITVIALNDTWVIRIGLPDLTAYNVTDRYKQVICDKQTMLPSSFRYHQITLGKLQDLFYELTAVVTGNAVPSVLSPALSRRGHAIVPDKTQQVPAIALSGTAPLFTLPTSDGKEISLAGFRGQVVLLDFWEIWCGPCLEAMPAVEKLSKNYGGKGLVVLGINCDPKSRSSAIAYLKNKDSGILQLMGQDSVKNIYKVSAVPHYVLISRTGEILFSRPGFSDSFDTWIQSALQ